MRAVFLDRDGVICKNRDDYVKNWAEFEFLPGAKEGLIALNRLQLPIIVVTNQSAVSKHLMSVADVEAIHQRMMEEIVACGGKIDKIYFCPHASEDNCTCRKPKPGMFLQAARELGIDLPSSYLIGDAATDIIAGQEVGCRTILVLTGRGSQQILPAYRSTSRHFTIVRHLMGAATQILKFEMGIIDQISSPARSISYTS